MTTTSTSTLTTLSVPDPSTSLELGEGTVVPGIYVDTVKHVRLNATGAATEADLTDGATVLSDAIAQASGQVWLQALQNVVFVASDKAMVSSVGSTFFNAAKGMVILSGFAPDTIASETTPGSIPAGVVSYDDAATSATTITSVVNTAVLGVVAATKILQGILGHGRFWSSAVAAAANAAGGVVNSTAFGWVKNPRLPGIHMFSQGGTTIGATFGATEIVGFAGVLMASPFTSTFSLWSSKIRGFKKASVSAAGPVDIASLLSGVARGYSSLSLSARTGEMRVRGAELRIGVPNKPPDAWPLTLTTKVPAASLPPWKTVTVPYPQKVTEEIELTALDLVDVQGGLSTGLIAERGAVTISSQGGDTTILGGEGTALVSSAKIACMRAESTMVRASSDDFTIGQSDSSSGVSSSLTREAPDIPETINDGEACIVIDKNGVSINCGSGNVSAQFQPSVIDWKAKSGTLKITSSAVALNGKEVKIQ